ncbi:MAG: type II secretion system protein N [Legionellales bacterium]|jgi:type II secretory pathway component PulC
MLNTTQLQSYLEQDHVARGIFLFLLLILLLIIFNIFKISFTPQSQSVAVETITHTHNHVFVASPLFGQSPNSGVLQETRLSLNLKGIFAASTSATGSAVIGTSKGERIYIVGDTVEGAIIQDIQPDYVVLEFQGNQEILRLPEGERLTSSK